MESATNSEQKQAQPKEPTQYPVINSFKSGVGVELIDNKRFITIKNDSDITYKLLKVLTPSGNKIDYASDMGNPKIDRQYIEKTKKVKFDTETPEGKLELDKALLVAKNEFIEKVTGKPTEFKLEQVVIKDGRVDLKDKYVIDLNNDFEKINRGYKLLMIPDAYLKTPTHIAEFNTKINQCRDLYREVSLEKKAIKNIIAKTLGTDKIVSTEFKRPPKNFFTGEVITTGKYFCTFKTNENDNYVNIQVARTSDFLKGAEYKNREQSIAQILTPGELKYVSYTREGLKHSEYKPAPPKPKMEIEDQKQEQKIENSVMIITANDNQNISVHITNKDTPKDIKQEFEDVPDFDKPAQKTKRAKLK